MPHKLLHDSRFVNHEYNTDNQTLYTEYYIFDYCCNFLYVITPEEQIWMVHQLNLIWSVAQVKKYVHIVPKEFINSLAVEQLFDKFFAINLSHQFELKHFADDRTEEASRWLLNSSNI